jgi:hypothetical protein
MHLLIGAINITILFPHKMVQLLESMCGARDTNLDYIVSVVTLKFYFLVSCIHAYHVYE